MGPSYYAAVLLLTLAVPAAAQSVPGRTFDFENAPVGKAPAGWTAPATPIFQATVSADRPHGGAACLEIRHDADARPAQPLLNFVQQGLDARPYRGKRVRFSGWLRAESPAGLPDAGSARIWLTSDGHPWSYENLGNYPVRGAQWTFAQVTGNVAADADTLRFGVALDGVGRAWADDLTLELVGPAGAGNQLPRALSERGTLNLVAFARLLGYVRHFHPSDEAAHADWDAIAIAGVDEVEDARTPGELATKLQRLFEPLAPTLRVAARPLAKSRPKELSGDGPAPSRIIGWQHIGWRGERPGVYSERRVEAPVEAPGDSLLPIGTEVNADLGGGVWASMPLTLYVRDHVTVPRGAALILPAHHPAGWTPNGNDRATRLADVILFWNVVQHFYPYFSEVAVDWPVQLPIALRAAATCEGATAFDWELRRMLAALDDGHGYESSPFVPSSLNWPFAWAFVENRLVLTAVDPASGLRLGEEVRAACGRPIGDWIAEAQAFASGSTPARRQIMTAIHLLSMLRGDAMELELRSPTGEIRKVLVSPRAVASPVPARPDSVAELRPGVFYLDVNRITDEDLEAARPRFAAARGVIFDLRGYPNHIWTTMLGALTDSTLTTAHWGRPVILRPDHADTTCAWSDWTIAPSPPRIPGRIVFLIDANAISASETILGIVEHYRLADLVGEPTAGTNGNVTGTYLPGRYYVQFTGMRVRKHDGSRHHGVGILPTVPVSPTVAGIAAGRDEQLERALELVGR